ncbi:MAG: hypothetical protein Kow00109_25770 [Acidobacteriota bacterium]
MNPTNAVEPVRTGQAAGHTGAAARNWLAYLNSFWRVPLILLVTGIMSTISVCCSVVDGGGRLQHWCARRWADFILWVSRVRVDVEGLEQLEPGRGYVFMANHLSMFDIWGFLHLLPFQFRFVAKESLFKIPFLGWHLRRSGNVPVARGHPRQTLRLYQSLADRIASGMSYVVYPEGGRTWDGTPGTFRRGAFLLPRHARAPIVPVTIIGAHRRLRRGSVIIHPGKMRMIFHPPLEYETYRDWTLDHLAERVRAIILERYELQ